MAALRASAAMRPRAAQIRSIPALPAGEACSRCSIIGLGPGIGVASGAATRSSGSSAARGGDQREFGNQFRLFGEQQTPDVRHGGQVAVPWIVETRPSCEAAPTRCSKPASNFEKRRGIGADRAVLDDFIDRERLRHRQRPAAPQGRRTDQRFQQQFLFGLRCRGSVGSRCHGPRISAISASTGGAASSPSGAGTRSTRQVRLVEGGPPRQLDPAEPAIRQLGNDSPGFVEQGEIGGRGPHTARVTRNRAWCGTRPNGARAHPPKAPRQKARAGEVAGIPGLPAISASNPCSAPSSSAG